MKFKSLLLAGVVVCGIGLVGCTPVKDGRNYTGIEKVALTVLEPDELTSIKETVVPGGSKNKSSDKDLTITLNLAHSAKDVALDNALLKSTRVLSVLEEAYKKGFNNYKFIINTADFDVYGNEQKMKILEIVVDAKDADKIKFENFDYKNLEKISTIKEFNYMKEDKKEDKKENPVTNSDNDDVKTQNTDNKIETENKVEVKK